MMRIRTSFSRLVAATLTSVGLALGSSAHAQGTPDTTKVSVAILYLTADVGIFMALERGYFAEQKLDVQLNRVTSAGDVISMIATDRLDVASGGATPGLFNAFRRGLPIQIVSDKSAVLPPGTGAGNLLVRNALIESGEVKTVADLRGKRIAVNNIQSPSLNYVLRGLAPAGLGMKDVTLVEMPFNQFIPAFQKNAVDAAMVYAPLWQTIAHRLKLATPLPEAELTRTSFGDTTNLMFYSPAFTKTDAAKRFMVAHVKAQRDYQRMLDSKADMTPVCQIVNKYIPAMPADCSGMSFTGVDPDGGVNLPSLEKYQDEWLKWGIMSEPADIRRFVNLEFSQHAVRTLGPYRK